MCEDFKAQIDDLRAYLDINYPDDKELLVSTRAMLVMSWQETTINKLSDRKNI